MDIGYCDLPVRAGNSLVKEFEWEFDTSDGDPEPPSFVGTKFVFRAVYGAEVYQLATDDGSGNLAITGARSVRLRIPYDVTDTWGDGWAFAYELEWWDGVDQFTLLEGALPVSVKVNSNV